MGLLSLQERFKRRVRKATDASPVERATFLFLEQGTSINTQTTFMELLGEFSPIERFRGTLALIWMNSQQASKRELKRQGQRLLSELTKSTLWDSHQLAQAYLQLCRYLCGLPLEKLHPQQTPSGAAPIEWKGYWPWAGVPFLCEHAELGVLWALLGALTEDENLLESVHRLALWQTQTLDGLGYPSVGLFEREGTQSLAKTLAYNATLFHAVASHSTENAWLLLAERQLHLLDKLPYAGALNDVPASLALISSRWLDHAYSSVEWEAPLRGSVCDPHTSFVVSRSPQRNIACTLCGGNSGLGSFMLDDVGCITYGPSHLPTYDCKGFGIESPCTHFPSGTLDMQDEAFVLEGRVRLCARPSSEPSIANDGVGEPAGVWMNLRQELRHGRLSICSQIHSIHPVDTIAFSFFARAMHCVVDDTQDLRPRSTDRYRGRVRSVRLEGLENTLLLSALPGRGEMEVVALPGGQQFWGADFLISHKLDASRHSYSWQLTPAPSFTLCAVRPRSSGRGCKAQNVQNPTADFEHFQ